MTFWLTNKKVKLKLAFIPFFMLLVIAGHTQEVNNNLQWDDNTSNEIRLKNKIVKLDNPVYQFLDLCEASGLIEFLPQEKPYTKIAIIQMIQRMLRTESLDTFEEDLAKKYLNDFSRATNAFHIHHEKAKNTYALLGFGANTIFRASTGELGTYSTSLTGTPFITGDLGNQVSFFASIGSSFDRLSPDLFYESYTANGKVNFKDESIGYSFLPYQFNYETMYQHIMHKYNEWAAYDNINKELGIGMIYYTELNANLLDGAVQLSMNNQRRSWGHDNNNLVLSSTARRFSGIEFKIRPASWLNYSLLVGSLFSPQSRSTKDSIVYGYDTGLLENMYTLQMLTYTPTKWMQMSATLGTIWSKRMELSYLLPFTFSHFSQLENGDYDNNTMSIDMAFSIPKAGKAWISFFNDEMSFDGIRNLFKKPRNRYAIQLGLKSSYLSKYMKGTYTVLKYTRVTPFAYTHYPEYKYSGADERPANMTYTHDGYNLGFYLPPNSGEYNLTITNLAIPDLIITLDNKLIIHGTNDLASDNNYQIFGDVNRHQTGEILDYPLSSFRKDGIYDWTILNEAKLNLKIRNKKDSRKYVRLIGSVGVANTWWKANNSGITAPDARTMLNFSLGLVVDI